VAAKALLSEARLKKSTEIRQENAKTIDGLRIGFIGNEARFISLQEMVLPALATLSQEMDVEFFHRDHPLQRPPDALRLSISSVPFSPAFDVFLDDWSSLSLDVLVHPPVASDNAPYKSDNVILVAAYLGAVPILSPEPAFSDFRSDRRILFAETSSELQDHLRRLADPTIRAESYVALLEMVSERFGASESTIAQVVNQLPGLSAAELWNRMRKQIVQSGSGAIVGPRALRLALALRTLALKLRPFGVMKLARLLDTRS
jgi:hypothetical protein